MVARTKVPCCSVCHTRYNEDERVPLLPTPPSLVPVAARFPWSGTLSKVCGRTTLCLPSSTPHPAAETSTAITRTMTTEMELLVPFRASSSHNSSCGPVIEVGAHPEMKLVRQIGEESSGPGGVEMRDATVAGGGGRCNCISTVRR